MIRGLLPTLLLILVGCANDIRYREDVQGALPKYSGVEHIRYNGKDDIAGSMQTAVEHWKDGKGHHVALVGAIHVGDEVYYQAIQKLLAGYDVALFELVKPAQASVKELAVGEGEDMYSPLAGMFGLSAQGSVIDYRPANFEWLDMSAERFNQRMQAVIAEHMPKVLGALGAKRGASRKEVRAQLRSAMRLMMRRLDADGKRAMTGALLRIPPRVLSALESEGPNLGGVIQTLMRIVLAPLKIEKALYQRRGKAEMFEDKYQHMLASSSIADEGATDGAELPGAFGQALQALLSALGRVILQERDQVVVDGIAAKLKAGTLAKKTAVFYGAAHLPGIGKGLKKLGFRKTGKRWLTALAITKPAK